MFLYLIQHRICFLHENHLCFGKSCNAPICFAFCCMLSLSCLFCACISCLWSLCMLKIQYKYLVNNKKLIAAFKQKICLCLTEHLFWLVFNFSNNAWMCIYRSDLSLLRFYSSGCLTKVNINRISCNPFMAHSSLIRRYINCSFSDMTGTKLLFHYIDLKALKFFKFKDPWMIICSDTSGTLGAALN